jgi:hypothetical protein
MLLHATLIQSRFVEKKRGKDKTLYQTMLPYSFSFGIKFFWQQNVTTKFYCI